MGMLLNCRLIAALTLGAALASAVETKELDVRKGPSSGDTYVSFWSMPDKTVGPGYAYVTIGEKDGVEAAYGLYPDKGELAVGTISEEVQAALSKSDDGAGATVLKVQVDDQQYALVKSTIEKWTKKTGFDLALLVAGMDFVENVVRPLGLKAPFRSVLAGDDPQVYFDDLSKLNRPKGEKK